MAGTVQSKSIHSQNTTREIAVDVYKDITKIEQEWKALQAEKTSFIYQDYDWARIAYDIFDAGNQPFIVVARQGETILFILPLVLVSGFPGKLRWVGNNHANNCCGLYSRGFLENPGQGIMRQVFKKMQKHAKGIVLLHLKNQPKTLAGFSNPILQLQYQPGPNPFYELDLRPGLDAILDMGNGKRKRKLFRQQQRAAERIGGYELIIPDSEKEIRLIMNDFFAHKALRFKDLGVRSVFSDEETRRFLTELAISPVKNNNQALRLYVLKVGGKMRAMYGAGITGKHCQCYINAVVYDEFADNSPGEMILYLMLDQLISQGYEKFDLGLGYERYKYSWCQESIQLVETIYPLSFLAIPFKWYTSYQTQIKDGIKNNKSLWAAYKRFRKLTGNL